MAWVSWNRKSADAANGREPLGLDLTASRARAALGRTSKNKLFALAEPRADLELAIGLDKRVPEVGHAALGISRKLPHLVCSGYLPFLQQPQEWKAGRHVLTAEAAVGLALERLRTATNGHDTIALALPAYLSVAQVSKVIGLAEKARFKVRGTASAPLALAAERATHFLHGQREEVEPARGGRSISPTTVLVVDADDHAMTASLVRLTENEVRATASATFPRLGIRFWRERLLDSLCDRCVRLCRRDPRDNADVEQALFDQIEEAVERARAGQRISLTVRSTHWYQDLVHSPAEFDAFCSPPTRLACDELRLLSASREAEPPGAVWLTHDAGRLPGLAAGIHQAMAEKTSVRVLHPEAAAAAAANLIERWEAGEVPKTHLDTAIPLAPLRAESRTPPVKAQAAKR